MDDIIPEMKKLLDDLDGKGSGDDFTRLERRKLVFMRLPDVLLFDDGNTF